VADATPFPIQLKEHGVDFLLDHRHLWIRTPRQAAILRIRAEAIRAARDYMDGQGYTLTDAPMFTPAAEGPLGLLFEECDLDDNAPRSDHHRGHGYGFGKVYVSRRSAPKKPRRAATSQKSGCSNPKPLTPNFQT
jgi:aspartyl/asparaginyl-tRNA synthetase